MTIILYMCVCVCVYFRHVFTVLYTLCIYIYVCILLTKVIKTFIVENVVEMINKILFPHTNKKIFLGVVINFGVRDSVSRHSSTAKIINTCTNCACGVVLSEAHLWDSSGCFVEDWV